MSTPRKIPWIVYVMPEGHLSHSTEEERTVAITGPGSGFSAAPGWVSIATFGNRRTTARLRAPAVVK
jgi:hypothetical protein